MKESNGWRALEPAGAAGPLVLLRRIGPVELAYAPYAFTTTDAIAPSAIRAHIEEVVARLPASTTLLRWDSPFDRTAFAADAVGLVEAPVRVQPPDTVLVDLSAGERAVLDRMKSKTRYNVRLAERRGVEIEGARAGVNGDYPTDLAAWYAIYEQTARRDRITIHPYRYYERAFTVAAAMHRAGEAVPVVELLTARYDGELLGGAITASWHGTTTYLYGASSDRHRNLMAPALVQWEAMRRAIGRGDHTYDLFGIPPSDDPSHPMHGLYRFKTGFGGRIVHRHGALDRPLQPLRAAAYRRAEAFRGWYYHRWRKR